MMNPTPIPWADFTWNPITGCTFGCEWCYARKAAILHQRELPSAVRETHDLYWTAGDGAVFPAAFDPTIYPHRLDEPLRRKKSAVIFLGSKGDVFDPAFPDSFRDRIFATVAAAHWHTFVVLTKRAAEMHRYFLRWYYGGGANRLFAAVDNRAEWVVADDLRHNHREPEPNLVLGVSVTNQADADERIPLLLDTPAAKRMVSVEPMLGPVDVVRWTPLHSTAPITMHTVRHEVAGTGGASLDFIAVGGQTPGKPLHEQVFCPRAKVSGCRTAVCPPGPCVNFTTGNEPAYWLRSLRDQCLASGVPFHYKHGGTNPPLDGVVYDPALCAVTDPDHEEG